MGGIVLEGPLEHDEELVQNLRPHNECLLVVGNKCLKLVPVLISFSSQISYQPTLLDLRVRWGCMYPLNKSWSGITLKIVLEKQTCDFTTMIVT